MTVRKFTLSQRDSIREYYLSRKLGFKAKSKSDCLQAIQNSIQASCKIRSFSACAGTFWFRWKDEVTTVHNEANWWKMKVSHRKPRT